jgi:hypothetical protein
MTLVDGRVDIFVVQGLLQYIVSSEFPRVSARLCIFKYETECHLTFLTPDNNKKQRQGTGKKVG